MPLPLCDIVRVFAANISKMIRVLLADDHAMLREGLAALIEAQADMTVVGHAATSTAAVERTRILQPDVAIVDLLMPGGGLNAVAKIRIGCPKTHVLALSVLDDIEHVRAAVAGGARGYLVKRVAGRELLSAIREAQGGQSYIGINGAARAELSRSAALPPETEPLTAREMAVLRLLAYGYTHREIAERLSLSKKTVDLYRTRLYQKLHVRGRAALVRVAVAAGLFGVPPRQAPFGR